MIKSALITFYENLPYVIILFCYFLRQFVPVCASLYMLALVCVKMTRRRLVYTKFYAKILGVS